MQKYMKNIIGTAVIAALGLVSLVTTERYASAQAAAAQPPAAAQTPAKKGKQVKDTNEYDIYNEVIKDSQSNPPNGKKFLQDLDNWTAKYPDTEFKDNRQNYYVLAYRMSNELGKAVDAAKPLIDKGVDALKEGLDTTGAGGAAADSAVLSLLFTTAGTAGQLAATGTPTDEQLATGMKAAQMLADFGKYFFSPDKRGSRSEAEWAQGLKQVEDQAKVTQFQIAVYPGLSALKANPKDPAANARAEAAFRKAAEQFPDSGYLANQIASAELLQQSVSPEKAQAALYHFARAAALPAGGIGGLEPTAQKNVDTYLTRAYTTFHGSTEGLAELKQMAAANPNPPADFKIKTASEIAAAAEAEFQQKNPQLAMWNGIKKNLTDSNGQQYFEEQLKEHDMSGEGGQKLLKGTVVEGKPSNCRPKEILVGFAMPNATGTPTPEITLKFDAPLAGKVEPGSEISFNGVPMAFQKEPFNLTMDTEKSKVDVATTPCAAAPATKKGGTTTKKGN